MVQIYVNGLGRVNRMLNNCSKNIDKEMGKESESVVRDIRNNAQLRAPRWSGQLRNSFSKVTSNKDKEYSFFVGSPYAAFQEYGFKPHFVGLGRSTRAGAVVGDWATSKGMSAPAGSGGALWVQGHHPFVVPAIAKISSSLPNRFQKVIRKSLGR